MSEAQRQQWLLPIKSHGLLYPPPLLAFMLLLAHHCIQAKNVGQQQHLQQSAADKSTVKSRPLGPTQRDRNRPESDIDCIYTENGTSGRTAGAAAVSEGLETTFTSQHRIEDSIPSLSCLEPLAGKQHTCATATYSHNDELTSESPQVHCTGRRIIPNVSCATFSTEAGHFPTAFNSTQASFHEDNSMLHMLLKTRQKLVDEMKKLHTLKREKAEVCEAQQVLARMLCTFSKDVLLRAPERANKFGKTTATRPVALAKLNSASKSQMDPQMDGMNIETQRSLTERGSPVQEVSETTKAQSTICVGGGGSRLGEEYARAWRMVGYRKHYIESLYFSLAYLAVCCCLVSCSA